VAEAALKSERATFEKEECLENDLNQALAIKDAAEARVQTVAD